MNNKYSSQRTTYKQKSDGDLSEIDMVKILDIISAAEVNQCELTCDLNN